MSCGATGLDVMMAGRHLRDRPIVVVSAVGREVVEGRVVSTVLQVSELSVCKYSSGLILLYLCLWNWTRPTSLVNYWRSLSTHFIPCLSLIMA